MADTVLLRSSANARNASPHATSAKPHAQLSGALPVVQVNMNANGPQIQGAQRAKQGVMILPPKAGTRHFTTGGLPNQPAKQSVVISPLKEQRATAAAASSSLTADHVLFCRHLVDKYLVELRTSAGDGPLAEVTAANVKLAEETIRMLDEMMIAITSAAAVAAATPAAPVPAGAAGVPRAISVSSRGAQVASTTAPRRVPRPNLPPVTVRMDDGRPVVQADPVNPPSGEQDPAAPLVEDAQG